MKAKDEEIQGNITVIEKCESTAEAAGFLILRTSVDVILFDSQ